MRKFSPAFIGIGTSYAGLGELMAWLGAHPQVSSHIPSTHYFATRAYSKGASWYQTALSTHQKPQQLVGEASASYLHSADVPARIAHDCPDTKLIVVLRHPIRRMLAEYDALTRIDAKAQTLSAAAYIAAHTPLQTESLYADALERYFAYYSALDCRVVFYEELANSPLETMHSIYDFLAVDADFVPKALKHLAPPPEEPKHPSLLYRGRTTLYSVYQRLFVKPKPRLFPVDDAFDHLLTPQEWEVFAQFFATDADKLSRLLNRNMKAYWSLVPQTEQEIR
jgi:Sulfotransferase family